MLAFLLDANVSAAVADGVRAVRPGCRVEHVSRWRGGAVRQATDEEILAAAHTANLVLVTYDVSTIPAIIHRWLVQNRPLPGVPLIPAGAVRQQDIGGITRALVRLIDDRSVLASAYPVAYLRPTT